MKYEIWGNSMPAVTLTLASGESIYTQSGGMTWMSDGISMTTNARGGFGKSIGRMFMGESIFMVTYTAQRPESTITLASTLPGTIKAFRITPGYELIAQKQSFLCATQGIELSVKWTRRMGAGLFGGEGLFLTKLTGPGKVWLQTMTIPGLAARLAPYLPSNNND